MKIKTTREQLLAPLGRIVGVVERRQTIPLLSNVYIDAGKERGVDWIATDLEVELKATESEMEVVAGGTATLPARKLLDICRALPEGANVEIEVTSDRGRIASGRSRFTLQALDPAEYPRMNADQERGRLALGAASLRTLLERTRFAMAVQDVRYYLNGLLLEMGNGYLRAIATDGHRLAWSEVVPLRSQADPLPLQAILPRKGVSELARVIEDPEAEVEIALGESSLRATFPDGTLVSKLVDARYPDYQRVMPPEGNKRLRISAAALREALGRAAILSNEKYRGVRLRLETGNLGIQANNLEQEVAEVEIEADYTGEPLEIGFNVHYMIDALSQYGESPVEISLSDPGSSCLITSDADPSSRYVVMPLRL